MPHLDVFNPLAGTMRRSFPPPHASLLLLALVAFASSAALAQSSAVLVRHSRIVAHPESARDIELLQSLDVDHMHGGPDGVTLVVSHDDLEHLRREGLRVDVVIAELERYYEERSLRDLIEGSVKSEPTLHRLRNFVLGSIGGYYSATELEAQLGRMAELYPALVGAPERIGTTHEGRPILAARISARASSDQSVPEAFFNALHHAREPAGMMSLVYSMWSLLEGYGSDPEITYLLDNRALWFVPMVNPDGYMLNAARFPGGGGLWRKNMRNGGDSGVDLNRNYGPQEFWSHPIGGSSTNVKSDTYRGAAPFSEPETQAIRDFCLRRRFVVALNHHTYSNLLIQPEEILSLGAADSVYYKTATRALASLAGFAPGNSRITVGYTARGTSDEWLYAFGRDGGGHVFSWTPESGNGEDEFWPVASRIEPICEAGHRMNMGVAWAAGAAPIITARSWRADTGGAVVRVTVTNIGRAAMTMPATLALDGGATIDVPPMAPSEALTFELPVPGSYRAAPGAPRPTIGITLGFESARVRDSVAPITHPVERIFTEDFEVGISRWETGPGWGIETTSEHTRVAGDSPGGNYVERSEPNILTLRAPISLRGYAAAELFFDASYAVEGRNHNASLQVRREPTIEWEDAECEELQLPFESASPIRNRFRGDMREWRRYRVRLDRYAGDEISIRFAVEAHNSQFHYTFDGVRIDDIEVVGARPIVSAIEDDDARAGALRITPNPFSDQLVVVLGDDHASSSIELCNELGEIVRSVPAGPRTTIATDDLAAGAYTVVVRSEGGLQRRRVVLVR